MRFRAPWRYHKQTKPIWRFASPPKITILYNKKFSNPTRADNNKNHCTTLDPLTWFESISSLQLLLIQLIRHGVRRWLVFSALPSPRSKPAATAMGRFKPFSFIESESLAAALDGLLLLIHTWVSGWVALNSLSNDDASWPVSLRSR